eukprot:Polyplicarium_translucidae@DN2242_c0_g1_i2.p2
MAVVWDITSKDTMPTLPLDEYAPKNCTKWNIPWRAFGFAWSVCAYLEFIYSWMGVPPGGKLVPVATTNRFLYIPADTTIPLASCDAAIGFINLLATTCTAFAVWSGATTVAVGACIVTGTLGVAIAIALAISRFSQQPHYANWSECVENYFFAQIQSSCHADTLLCEQAASQWCVDHADALDYYGGWAIAAAVVRALPVALGLVMFALIWRNRTRRGDEGHASHPGSLETGAFL